MPDSGISRGTESLVFRGEVPASQYEVMRAPFQEGEFPGPVKYGYASVGEVWRRRHGATWSGARSSACTRTRTSTACPPTRHAAPRRGPAERAVLAANMETAVNVVWDARTRRGDRIVVIGAGVVGLLVAWLCSAGAGHPRHGRRHRPGT